MRRWMLGVALLFCSWTLSAQVVDGDRLYARRAEGHQGGIARSEPISAAIAAYQRAVAQNPADLDARAKLLAAVRFKGAYVAQSNDQKKQIYSMGKTLAAEALTALERGLKPRGINSLMKASEKDVVKAAKGVPHAAAIFVWDAAIWGEWALAYGKMAAVRQGAADRIKRSSTLAMLIDPSAEEGGGARILGRLHSETPHVPLVTGWASDKSAVKYLRESLARSPKNKVTKVFLAEAMLAVDAKTRNQARQLLEEVLTAPNDPDYLVENIAAQNDARVLMKKLK